MKKSKLGYKRHSPDVNNPYNIIPSGRITMKDVDFPVYGVDDIGYAQIMYPGGEYQFPGNEVFEMPVAQFGMSTKKVDRFLNANKDLNWVQRLYEPNTPSIQIPGQQGLSTHFMESADGRVYPTVVQMPDGNLQYLGEDAYDYADETGEYIQFNNDRQARRFAKNYKKGTGVLDEFGSGGLKQWFDEKWVDVKTGKECGRSGKDKNGRPYPACRPSRRVNSTTPKTTSEMSSSEKAKFKREKTSGQRINYNHKRAQAGLEIPQPYIRPDFFSPQQLQAAEQRLQQDRTAAARAYATPATGRIEGEGLIDAVLPVVAAPMVKAVAKPLARVADDLGNKFLPNAYKYNPWAFKTNEANWYRQVGQSAIDDALETKLIREAGEEVSPRMWGEFQDQIKRLQGDDAILDYSERYRQQMLAGRRPSSPYFAKGELFYPMDKKITMTKTGKVSKNPAAKGTADYLIETTLPNESFQSAYVKGMYLGIPEEIGSTAILKPKPALRTIDNFNFYKKDWLRGYKPVQYQQGGQLSASAGYDSWYNSPMAGGRYTFNPKDPAEYYVEGYGAKQGPGIAAGMDYTNPKYRTQAMLRAGLDPEIGASLRAQGGYRFNPIDNRREQLTWGPYGGVRFQTEDYQQGVSNQLGYNNLQTDLAYGVNARYNKALANRGRFSIEGDLGMAMGKRPEGNLGEGLDPRFYGAVKATYSPPMYKNTRNRKPGPTTYSSGYQMGGSMTPQGLSPAFFTGMKDAAVDAFKTFMASPDASVPEQFEKVSAPVDWTKLSRPEQIKYGIDQITALEAEENRKPLENLLEATAYMENRYGEDPKAYGRKYTSSFMSIDPIALKDMFTGRGAEGRYNSAQQRQFENFKKLNLPTDQKEFNALLTQDNPVAAMAAARYRYALVPQALPDMNNPEAMFNYWLKYYNGNGVLKHQSRAQAFKDFQKAYKRALSND
jgi:hypothetical protein